MQKIQLSQNEVDRRIAVLRRLRELLLVQREKFQAYLHTLEQQEHFIHIGDLSAVKNHTELSEALLHDLQDVQNAIIPMASLYNTLNPQLDKSDVPHLQTDLHQLQARVMEQNQKNQLLLREHMATVKHQINDIKNNTAYAQNPYSVVEQGSRIDLHL